MTLDIKSDFVNKQSLSQCNWQSSANRKNDRCVTHSRNISNNKLYIILRIIVYTIYKGGASQGEWAIGYDVISTHKLFRLVLLALRFFFYSMFYSLRSLFDCVCFNFFFIVSAKWWMALRCIHTNEWHCHQFLLLSIWYCLFTSFIPKRSIATQHRHNYIIALI